MFYFIRNSKVPVNLAHSDITNVSTIVVKADVHMAENSTQRNMYNSSSNNGTQSKRQKKLNMELSQLDTISIVESENINVTSKTRKRNQHEQNKHRWSLRIKLQSCENRNVLPGNLTNSLNSVYNIFITHEETKYKSLPNCG